MLSSSKGALGSEKGVVLIQRPSCTSRAGGQAMGSVFVVGGLGDMGAAVVVGETVNVE